VPDVPVLVVVDGAVEALDEAVDDGGGVAFVVGVVVRSEVVEGTVTNVVLDG
jgi:hypothetical protein